MFGTGHVRKFVHCTQDRRKIKKLISINIGFTMNGVNKKPKKLNEECIIQNTFFYVGESISIKQRCQRNNRTTSLSNTMYNFEK
jgi:hypothetical protein